MGSAPCVDEATANEAISLRAPRSFDDTALTKITGQYPIHAPSPLTEHQTINTSITSCREISSTVRPLPVPLAVESPLDSVTFHPRSRPWTLSRTLSSDASRAVDLRLMRANCCASTVIPRPSPSTFDGSVGAPLTKETLGMRHCTTAEGLGEIRRFAQNGYLVRIPSPQPNRAIPSSTLHVPIAAPVLLQRRSAQHPYLESGRQLPLLQARLRRCPPPSAAVISYPRVTHPRHNPFVERIRHPLPTQTSHANRVAAPDRGSPQTGPIAKRNADPAVRSLSVTFV